MPWHAQGTWILEQLRPHERQPRRRPGGASGSDALALRERARSAAGQEQVRADGRLLLVLPR
eukprot:6923136-Alexandrium_andersonii.AAC.1